MTPADILATIATWPDALLAEWDQCAALIEGERRVSRAESERLAFEMLQHRAPVAQNLAPAEPEQLRPGR